MFILSSAYSKHTYRHHNNISQQHIIMCMPHIEYVCFTVPYCRANVLIHVKKISLQPVAVAIRSAHNNTMMVPVDMNIKEVVT